MEHKWQSAGTTKGNAVQETDRPGLGSLDDANNLYGYDDTYKRSLNNRFSINLIAIGLRIINGANKFSEKYKMIKDILSDEVYCNAISNLDISYMPIHWKTFFWSARHRYKFFVYTLLVIMSSLASKK